MSHPWVTSSNVKGHEKPLSSGGLGESLQAISAVTNGTCVTHTHRAVSQGKGWRLALSEVTQARESARLRDRINSSVHLFCDLRGRSDFANIQPFRNANSPSMSFSNHF